MKHAGFVAVFAILGVMPAVAQQPAPRDTTRHGMMGHQMPAQGTGQHQMTRGHSMPGEMTHDSAMGCGMMSGGGMTTVMVPEPAHLLEMKAELGLTPTRSAASQRSATPPGRVTTPPCRAASCMPASWRR